jgi:hypothetical protein
MSVSAIAFDPVSRMETEASMMLQAGPEVALDYIKNKPVSQINITEFAQDEDLDLDSPSSAVEPAKPLPSVNSPEVAEERESLAVQHPSKTLEPVKTRPYPNWLQLNHITASISEPTSGAKKLRKMIFETNQLIVCPGVYDGLSARTAIEVGFNALYMVSYPIQPGVIAQDEV